MNKVTTRLFLAFFPFLLLSCNGSKETATEEGGIQIDPELKELGELNALLFLYDDAGQKLGDCIAVKSKKKWGVINLNGDTIIDFKYDKIERLEGTEFWNLKKKNVEKSQYSDFYDVGIADSKGNVIVKPIKGNQSCKPISEDIFEAYRAEYENNYYNRDGEEFSVHNDTYDYDLNPQQVEKINDHFFMVLDGEVWLRMTKEKSLKYKVDTVYYSDVMPCENLCFVCSVEESLWGVIDENGNQIVPHSYKEIKNVGEKRIFVQDDNGKWGLFNGKSVSAYYDNCLRTIDNYSIVQDGDNYVILDKQGKELFKKNDMNVNPFFSNGVFIGNHCVYDAQGKTVISLDDTLYVQEYLNNYVIVMNENNRYGIVDKNGKTVVPVIYEMAPKIDEDTQLILLTRCERDEEINGERLVVLLTDIFNTQNGKLTKTNFSIDKFVDGLALAEVEGRHVYVNVDGKTGILNLEENLIMLAEKKEKAKQQEEEANLENIKEQLVETINKENGREILSSTYSIHDLTKKEDGTYRAEFYKGGEYDVFTYEIFDITVDKNNKVTDFGLKILTVRPTDKKPDGGIKTVEEIVKHQIGAVGY